MANTIFCNKCGSANTTDSKFCSDCGSKLKAFEEQAKPDTASQEQNTVEVEEVIKCPKCGSRQIHIDKKGYSGIKGCCGFAVCGPLGFLFGTKGADKLRKTCLKCNNSWM